MAMTTEAGSVQFSIGSVLSSTFGVYARNFISFTIIGLIIGLISLAFELLVVPSPATPEDVDYFSIALGAIVSMLVGGMMQAAVIYGTFQDMRGSRASIGDCIARGLAAIVPVIVASLIFSIAVTLASVLIVIPGIIVFLLWWLYVPAIVVEHKGIFESFGRSAELTKGRRWQILGLMLVVFLLIFIVMMVIGFAAAASLMSSTDGFTGEMPLSLSIAQYAISSIITVFTAILTSVCYYYLRAEKEGVGIEDLASVFD